MPSSVHAMTWWQYVQSITEGAQQKDIASNLGVDQSTVSRWKTGVPGKPENVAALARAYRRPVLEAVVAAGFLTERDARAKVTVPDIGALSDDDLLAEIKRRMAKEAGGEHEQRSAPMNGAGETPARKDYGLAARAGRDERPAAPNPEDESQDHGGDEPA